MAGGKIWTKDEIGYLKQNYFSKTNEELQLKLKRSFSGINFQAHKFDLQKKYKILKRSKKIKYVGITKELLEKLYINEGKSIRQIAKNFDLGKNTIAYYLYKYQIKSRNKKEANLNFYLHGGKTWREGKNAKNNESIRVSVKLPTPRGLPAGKSAAAEWGILRGYKIEQLKLFSLSPLLLNIISNYIGINSFPDSSCISSVTPEFSTP